MANINSEDLIKRLEDDAIPEPNTGCLLWAKAQHKFGYGQVRLNNKTYNVPRLLYELYHGKIESKKLVIRHRCDTPQCCNIRHLEIGTQKDNMNDASKRGRSRNQFSDKVRVNCKNGHKYEQGYSYCKICRAISYKKCMIKNSHKWKSRSKESMAKKRERYMGKNRNKYLQYMKDYHERTRKKI